SKPINILSDQNGKYTLVFSDVAKGVVTKTIDIRENNPFAGLGKKIKGDYYDTYVTGNKKFSDLFPGFIPEHYAGTPIFNNTTVIDTVYVSCRVEYSEYRHFALIAYVLGAEVGACRTIFISFDSTGNELSQSFVDDNVNRLVITNDGKYIAYTFGTWDVEEGVPIIKPGVKIIKISDKSILINKEIEQDPSVSENNGFVTITSGPYYSSNNQSRDEWQFLDLSKKKVYKIELSNDVLVRTVLKDGILVKFSDNSEKKLFFNKDFMEEDML
ncbi:MAG: hypothetical protein CVU06_16775, partial [Bacteroidetes bacterium HGW-Bacteroidetes-22]